MFRSIQLALLFVCATLAGCAPKDASVTTASGEQPSYAERYPEQLNSLRTRFATDEAKVQAALPELAPAANKLTAADPAALAELFELAHEEGQSGAYAAASLEREAVSRFMAEEKQPLHQKVAGSVSYAAKQKQCSEDLGGAAAGAMDRAVEKQLEERALEAGEVQRFVEDHEEQIGKANVAAAGKQASAIAELSHLAHVRLELYRRELEASLAEASSVRSTLDRMQRESEEQLADQNISRGRRALLEKRKSAAFQARAAIDAEVEQSQRALEDMSKRQKKLALECDQAVDKLVQGLESRAKK